jgi:hypothetical protein
MKTSLKMAQRGYSPSNLASAMQLRTRKEKKFDEIESGLAFAKSSTIPLAQGKSRLTSWLDRFNLLQPFAKPATNDDIVWLFDNTAYKSARTGAWQSEFVAAVFEREDKDALMKMVTQVVRAVGLADDAVERATVEERVLPFLWDIRPARTIVATQDSNKDLKLGPTNINGLASNMMEVAASTGGSLVKTSTKVGGGRGSITNMQTYYAGADGWGIISGMSNGYHLCYPPWWRPHTLIHGFVQGADRMQT